MTIDLRNLNRKTFYDLHFIFLILFTSIKSKHNYHEIIFVIGI